MKRALSQHLTFFREFRQTFHTTGAVAPSGGGVGRAFAEPLKNSRNGSGGFRILEVGPGTGAITSKLVRSLHPGDRFDAVELNERFVKVLQQRFQEEPDFRRVADQTRILHQSVEEVPRGEGYDFIACGLPFNNFGSDTTRRILRHLAGLLRDDGTLGFFEYVGIRRLKAMVTNSQERRRLARVGRVLHHYIDRYEFRRKTVLVNFPPVYVHFLKLRQPPRHGQPH